MDLIAGSDTRFAEALRWVSQKAISSRSRAISVCARCFAFAPSGSGGAGPSVLSKLDLDCFGIGERREPDAFDFVSYRDSERRQVTGQREQFENRRIRC